MLAKIQCANTLPLRMTGKVEQNDYVAKDSNLHFLLDFKLFVVNIEEEKKEGQK